MPLFASVGCGSVTVTLPPSVLHKISQSSYFAIYGESTFVIFTTLPLPNQAPTQVQIIPITDSQLNYAKKVALLLQKSNIRAETDDRSETMQNKIRQATADKIPFMLIIGQREADANTVSIRQRDGQDLKTMTIAAFIAKIKKLINTNSLNLIK